LMTGAKLAIVASSHYTNNAQTCQTPVAAVGLRMSSRNNRLADE